MIFDIKYLVNIYNIYIVNIYNIYIVLYYRRHETLSRKF